MEIFNGNKIKPIKCQEFDKDAAPKISLEIEPWKNINVERVIFGQKLKLFREHFTFVSPKKIYNTVFVLPIHSLDDV